MLNLEFRIEFGMHHFGIQNLESGIPYLKTRNVEFCIQNSEYNLEFGIWVLESSIQNSEQDSEFGIQNSKQNLEFIINNLEFRIEFRIRESEYTIIQLQIYRNQISEFMKKEHFRRHDLNVNSDLVSRLKYIYILKVLLL